MSIITGLEAVSSTKSTHSVVDSLKKSLKKVKTSTLKEIRQEIETKVLERKQILRRLANKRYYLKKKKKSSPSKPRETLGNKISSAKKMLLNSLFG